MTGRACDAWPAPSRRKRRCLLASGDEQKAEDKPARSAWEFTVTKSKAAPVLFPECSRWTRNGAKSFPGRMEDPEASGSLGEPRLLEERPQRRRIHDLRPLSSRVVECALESWNALSSGGTAGRNAPTGGALGARLNTSRAAYLVVTFHSPPAPGSSWGMGRRSGELEVEIRNS